MDVFTVVVGNSQNLYIKRYTSYRYYAVCNVDWLNRDTQKEYYLDRRLLQLIFIFKSYLFIHFLVIYYWRSNKTIQLFKSSLGLIDK